MLLKRIADVLPAELAELIPDLESVGIRTTESLIFTPPTYILSHIPLLQSVQLDALITSSLELTAPKALRDGQDERDEDDGSEESAWAGWGISGLDDVVAGWNGIGVMEIAGPKKVGKSLLALHATLRCLCMDETSMCRWIDTEGSFVPERAMRVLEYQGVKDVNRVLQRLVVIPCFKLDDVFEAIAQLSEVSARTRTSNLCHAELVSLTEEISELAYEHGMTAIIINSAVSSQPTNSQSSFNKMDIKPALGGAFTFCTDLTLLLQETGRIFGLMDANERERIRSEPGLRALVEVVRSRVCPSGKWTVFETDGAKLLDVIPPHEVDERTTRISAGLPTGPARPAIGSLAQTLAP
ncbi:hypothetical protein I317_07672 [Kwoniella heveanensis CBS 569]|nr:hypothetical protein I317_07672 [Kwoniella heveanensis CBS 569]